VRAGPLVAALSSLALAVTGCSGSGGEVRADAGSRAVTPTSAGVPSGGDAGLGRFYTQRLSWEPCEEHFQCATLTVPLDYANPDAGAIAIAVLRDPAADPAQRIGSLLVNPGGPGASGIDYAKTGSQVATEAVRDRHDVVGFDPRGVGRSDPLDCVDDDELSALFAADGSPDNPAEIMQLDALGAALAVGCRERSGGLLPHIGTANVARDLDVLRAVLGDSTLTYLGKSYGTLIGLSYARLFPTRVGRMVLDGVVDPTLTGSQSAIGQAKGFEESLALFMSNCVQDDCPLGRSLDTAFARFDRLMADIDASPLPTEDGRELTQSLALLGVVYPLYYDPSEAYPIVRAALERALDGDGTTLMVYADLYLDRSADGRFESNFMEVLQAVSCVDEQYPRSIAEVQALLPAAVAASPRFGAYLAWISLGCTHWPVPSQADDSPVTAPGAPPILVVGSTGDPATPYANAVSVADQLESGVLVTLEGSAHTAYRNGGSACVDAAVDGYLLEGTAPAAGLTCS